MKNKIVTTVEALNALPVGTSGLFDNGSGYPTAVTLHEGGWQAAASWEWAMMPEEILPLEIVYTPQVGPRITFQLLMTSHLKTAHVVVVDGEDRGIVISRPLTISQRYWTIYGEPTGSWPTRTQAVEYMLSQVYEYPTFSTRRAALAQMQQEA